MDEVRAGMDMNLYNQDAVQSLLAPLDQATAAARLRRLAQNLERFRAGEVSWPAATEYVNNHIHTCYSFSPYSPSDAAYRAWLEGLTTAGIMDHDSVGGAEEFIRAGRLLGIATTVGFECRCSMAGTPFGERRLNNPDQTGLAYVACHGIPHGEIARVDRWLAPCREKRNERNRRMTARINEILGEDALLLDFERDVLPLSKHEEGGSVTERHLLYALSLRLLAVYGAGQRTIDYLAERLQIPLDEGGRKALSDAADPLYAYTLLGILKKHLVERFYIDAAEECPPVFAFTAFARSIGAIPAYAYLGDVGQSVTGDKRTQAFEDGYLDELVPWLAENGFCALSFMPTRNSQAQLKRLMALCERYGLFQISGEDINSPAQSFVCPMLMTPAYRHLIRATWALIGHEKAATEDPDKGMFSEKTLDRWPDLQERIARFSVIGRTR